MIQTSLLMDHKIEQALDRIKAFEPPEGYYVAFSGGKDSIVVKDLVIKAGVKAELHMNMTSVDPPELVRYVKKVHPDVIRHKPVMSMWKLIEKHKKPPTRIWRFCCEELKEGGGENRFVITGVRWAESNKRRSRKMVESCTKSRTKRYLHAIIDWSDQEVWEYIDTNHLPYCSLYDEGFKRIGCIGCPMHDRRKDFLRWPRHEMLYRRAMEKLNGTYTFDWWICDRRKTPENEAQCVLFE